MQLTYWYVFVGVPETVFCVINVFTRPVAASYVYVVSTATSSGLIDSAVLRCPKVVKSD